MTRQRFGRWLLYLCVPLACVAAVSAEVVIVHLASGGTLRGDLAKLGEDYSLRTDDGVLTLKSSEVSRIEPLPAPDLKKEYEQRRSAVAADDIEGHVDILVWLIESQAWSLANEQCELILRRRPSQRLANRWHDPIRAKLGLNSQAEEAAQLKEQEEAENGGAPAPELMSRIDVNRIRLLELTSPQSVANPPRMRVRDTKRWDAINAQVAAAIAKDDDDQGSKTKAYLNASNAEQLFVLSKLTGAQFAEDIDVVGDPEPLREFRQRILPLVRETCGRSGCHAASGHAEGFRLPRTAGTGDRGVYAAFYQLDSMQTPTGPLINRDTPQRSMLIQYMLPREIAMMPHPELPEGEHISAPFNKPTDPYYEMLIAWIQSLKDPRPDYDLEYKLPE